MSQVPASPAEPTRARRPLWLAALAALVTFLAIYGMWARERTQQDAADAADTPGGLFMADQARGTSLAAVGRLTGLDQPCTAWLLDAGAAPEQPAYAVTTARCAGVADTSSIVWDAAAEGTLALNDFAKVTTAAQRNDVEVPVTRIAWASARSTDLALLELGSTYGQLADLGIRPIRPVAPAPEGSEILVAGVPVEGIPEDQRFLRGTRCRQGGTADVVEAGFWWPGLAANDCSGVLPGARGSVAFNPAGEAVGMVATSTIGVPGPDACAAGHPCEVSDGTPRERVDTNYAVSLAGLGACFADGRLELGSGCPLEDPRGVVPASATPAAVRPGGTLTLSVPRGSQPSLLVGPAGSVDCADAAGWRAASVGADGTVTLDAPTTEGIALACVGSAAHPTPLVVRVDGTPPDAGRIALEQTPVEAGVQVAPIPDPPELTAFRWVSGPLSSLDCATVEGYTEFRGTPAVIEAADLPATVCVIAVDAAGNASQPASLEVR